MINFPNAQGMDSEELRATAVARCLSAVDWFPADDEARICAYFLPYSPRWD
jgi:hypothetical protein